MYTVIYASFDMDGKVKSAQHGSEEWEFDTIEEAQGQFKCVKSWSVNDSFIPSYADGAEVALFNENDECLDYYEEVR